MKIYEVKKRNSKLIQFLLTIWEESVKETHLFLSVEEIGQIKEYVPQALMNVEHLIIVENNQKKLIAFMGIESGKLEMIFLSPGERGKGLGKQMIQYGIEKYCVQEVTVNEQNPQAVGFYEHLGFQIYKRTDYDEEGNPYPLLYMKLK